MSSDQNPESEPKVKLSMAELGGAAAGVYLGALGGVAIVGKSLPPKHVSPEFTQEQSAGIIAGTALVGAVLLASVVYGARRFLHRHRN